MVRVSVERLMDAASSNKRMCKSQFVRDLQEHYTLLGSGETGVVFEYNGLAAKIFTNGDKGYSNFVRSAIAVNKQETEEAWTKHFPKIHMFEQFERYSIVFMEKLITTKELEKKHKGKVKDIVSLITDSEFSTIEGAIHQAWGRLICKTFAYSFMQTDAYEHYSVIDSLDDALTLITQGCYEYGTFGDLNSSNMMFRDVGKGRYEAVVNDPFGMEKVKLN